MSKELNGIIWGSRLFVNTQFTYRLVVLLTHYYEGECTLQHIFRFSHAIQEQKRVVLYKELKTQLNEIIYLKKLLQSGKVPHEESVIRYTIDKIYKHFI